MGFFGALISGDYFSSFFEDFLFERSEFLIATSKKKNLCVCSTNLGFSVPHFMIPGTYYVPDTYDM